MGRKTRIILLSITAVLAVVTFIAMLAVRPGTESEVLAAARARQHETLTPLRERCSSKTFILISASGPKFRPYRAKCISF